MERGEEGRKEDNRNRKIDRRKENKGRGGLVNCKLVD